MSRAVLWDLGHTLVDWDPRRVYRSLLSDDAAVEQFLGGVCTMAWHTEHDRGVPMAENSDRTSTWVAVLKILIYQMTTHELLVKQLAYWVSMSQV